MAAFYSPLALFPIFPFPQQIKLGGNCSELVLVFCQLKILPCSFLPAAAFLHGYAWKTPIFTWMILTAGPLLATLSPVAGTVVCVAGCRTGSQNLLFGMVSRLFSLASILRI